MARFYVAGPLFSAQDRERLERLDALLTEAGHATFLPHRDAGDNAATRGPDDDDSAEARRRDVFQADIDGLAGCDAVVAMLDGADVDAGTAFEIGWAYANRRPVLGVRTDFRTLGPEGAVALMVLVACDRFLHAHDESWDVLAKEILAWTAEVRPWGGRLVRDGVPRLAKERGHALRFRQTTDKERHAVLKGKLAEVAREIAAAPAAVEVEHLADLLEATEAYIRERGWDRDTLRAIKERRWKERGGYDEGWIVDDAAAAEAEAKTTT